MAALSLDTPRVCAPPHSHSTFLHVLLSMPGEWRLLFGDSKRPEGQRREPAGHALSWDPPQGRWAGSGTGLPKATVTSHAAYSSFQVPKTAFSLPLRSGGVWALHQSLVPHHPFLVSLTLCQLPLQIDSSLTCILTTTSWEPPRA